MKSSFSWPGRPPAEMISRNANRLLTSILDGSQKRGAFYTSILDRTLKRGAFYTSILDGTPKRGLFCTSTLDGCLKRDAFFTSILGGSPKRGAFYTSILDGTPKRGAFYASILDGTPKRGAFDTSILGGRPKRGAFCTSILDGTPKRGAFCTSILDGTLKRDAFYTSYLVGSLRRGVFCLFYSSFLALMQEKKQKKIKASGMPANFCRVHHWRSRDLCHVPGKLPCLGRGCRTSWPGTSLERSGFVPRTRQTSLPRQRLPDKFAEYIIGEVGICATYQANFPASAEAAGQVGLLFFNCCF